MSNTKGKKKSIAIACGIVVATVAGAMIIFSNSVSQTAPLVASGAKLNNHVPKILADNKDITQEGTLPSDSPMVIEHKQQEKQRFENSVKQLTTFISAEDQLSGMSLDVENEPDIQDVLPSVERKDAIDQRSEMLAKQLEKSIEEDNEKLRQQTNRDQSNTANNALMAQLEQQRKLMEQMRREMDALNKELEAQSAFRSLNIQNTASLQQVMTAIVDEAVKVPVYSVYDYGSDNESVGGARPTSELNSTYAISDSKGNAFDYLNDSSLTADISQANVNSVANIDCEQVSCLKVAPGDIYYGLLFSQVNSDDIGYVVANVSSGPLAGAQLLGQPKLNATAKNVRIEFRKMTLNDTVYNINAIAVDPVTKRPGLADDVNSHYVERYGSLLAAGLMGSYSDTLITTEEEVDDDANTTTTTKGAIDSERDRWVYAVGKSLEPASAEIAQGFRRDATVTVESVETGALDQGDIGILFVDELNIALN